MKFCYNTSFIFLNNPKYLDPSYKMDLDIWDCFGRKKTPSYNQRNTVMIYGELVHFQRKELCHLLFLPPLSQGSHKGKNLGENPFLYEINNIRVNSVDP